MDTIRVTRHFTIDRETSPYNKYIKWFARTYLDNGIILSSAGYRTEREARDSLVSGRTMQIGRKVYAIDYVEGKPCA